MGAKASTANGGQSPRTRTFSTSSSSEVVSGSAGFSLLRAIPGIQVSNDRQRARSLSSVPDLHASHEAIAIPPNSQSYEASATASPDTDSSSNEEAGPVAGTSLALGRVYAAHSLPSHIWSINGGTETGPETEGCKAPSNCLPDGRYAPVQCKGNLFTGRCFCSDENGKRIFGQMWRDEADEMTCACSRRRAELEAQGKVSTLHCTESGDYEPLQCDGGMCWCAQPKTGQPTVTPIPEEDMTRLPCYSPAVIGEQYLRKCESLVIASGEIAEEQARHGTNFLGNPVVTCDYDGSYGPYQIRNSVAYCTGRDGEILGAWQATTSDMQGMNCNCARDTMIIFPARGMTVTETCMGNGNYRPNQNVGDVYYCVDSDGYHGELLDAWPSDNCASYA